MRSRYALRIFALAYLALVLALPIGLVFWRAFEHGVAPVWEAITQPNAMHAFWLTVEVTVIAVIANTVFGIVCAIALVRQEFRGKSFFNALIDLPFAVSPVVVGIALILVYGQHGWFGNALNDVGVQVIFSVPGIALATIFVSLPFVVREVVPVLRETGTEQEEAAATLGASAWRSFLRVTLPSIRWGLTYGVVLSTARALGEYGAVSVVSGNVVGSTQTLTLTVEERFHQFDLTGAYAASIVLAILALATLLAMNRLKPKEEAG